MPVLTGTPTAAAEAAHNKVTRICPNDPAVIELEAAHVAAVAHLTGGQLAAAMAEGAPEGAAATGGGDSKHDEFEWEDAEDDTAKDAGATQRTAPSLHLSRVLDASLCLLAADVRVCAHWWDHGRGVQQGCKLRCTTLLFVGSHPQQTVLRNEPFLG